MKDEIEGFKNDWKYEKVQRILESGKVQFPGNYTDVSYKDPREKEYYIQNTITTNMLFTWITVNYQKITNTANKKNILY